MQQFEKEDAREAQQGECSGLTASPFCPQDQLNTAAHLSLSLPTIPLAFPRVTVRDTKTVQTFNRKA